MSWVRLQIKYPTVHPPIYNQPYNRLWEMFNLSLIFDRSVARPSGFEPETLGLEGEPRGRPGVSHVSHMPANIQKQSSQKAANVHPVTRVCKQNVPKVSQASKAHLRMVVGDDLLSVKDVAASLGVSRCTVYRLCERGELPHLRISNAIRVRPSDLRHFIDALVK
jgi:excisionase family DNA binding protein